MLCIHFKCILYIKNAFFFIDNIIEFSLKLKKKTDKRKFFLQRQNKYLLGYLLLVLNLIQFKSEKMLKNYISSKNIMRTAFTEKNFQRFSVFYFFFYSNKQKYLQNIK